MMLHYKNRKSGRCKDNNAKYKAQFGVCPFAVNEGGIKEEYDYA